MSSDLGADRALRSGKKRGTKSAIAQETGHKTSKNAGQSSSGGVSGAKRGSMGLRIIVQLILGKREDVTVALIKEIVRKYGFLKRVSIADGRPTSKIVNVNANASSVSEALRIVKNLHGREITVMDVKVKLHIAHEKSRVKLDFKEIDKYHFDFSLDQAIYYKRVIQYDPRWYGRDDAYMDYKDVMTEWPSNIQDKPKYPESSRAGRFWQENCGADFKDLSAKFENPEKRVSKKEMDNFYDHLFHGIFDRGMSCCPDRGMSYEYKASLPGFSGWVIGVSQIKASGIVMVVSYVHGGFTEKSMEADSDGSGGEGSGKCAVPRMTIAIRQAVDDIKARLEVFAKDQPLDGHGAVEWIYGMTVYREKVFYSRLNLETGQFEILNLQNKFVSAEDAPKWRDLWQSVLTDDGYRRFQTVVNDVDNNIAAKV